MRRRGPAFEPGPLLAAGLLLLVIGMGIVVSNWPSTESYMFMGEVTSIDTGSEDAVLVGSLLALTGQIMTAIAVIALGVRLGNRDRAAMANQTGL